METLEKRSKIWSRFWAEQGVAVIHVDKLKIVEGQKLEDFIMRIEEPIYTSKIVGTEKKQFLIGIKCHWIDHLNTIQRANFHSCELIPYDIAKEGLIEVEHWLQR
jgi:uncharacterized protein YodC (DUF2158 family)